MKIFKNFLFALLGISLIMVTGEAPTALQQLLWSGSWLAVMAISGLTLNHIEKHEAHNEPKS